MSSAYAEIVQSGLISCVAECWSQDNIPPFGSLVACTANPTLFMVVSAIISEPRHGSSQARAYRKTQEQLQAEYPHIFHYLSTTIELVPVCWQSKNALRFQIPPLPAPLHTFVEPVADTLYSTIMQSDSWLPALFSVAQQKPLFDELLLAILYQALEKKALGRAHLEKLSHTFSVLTGNNYPRIKIFLQRLESLVY